MEPMAQSDLKLLFKARLQRAKSKMTLINHFRYVSSVLESPPFYIFNHITAIACVLRKVRAPL